MRLLYVDNHDVFARTATEQFLADHDVEIVPTIAEAKQRISANTYDVVLVDYDLDDGKGDELVRWMLGRSEARIVAVSATQIGNERLTAAGAHAVCAKAQFQAIRGVIGG